MPRCCKPALNSWFGSTVEWAYFKKFRPQLDVFFSGANPGYITCMNIMYISAMDLVPDPEFFELVGSGSELIDQDPGPDPTKFFLLYILYIFN